MTSPLNVKAVFIHKFPHYHSREHSDGLALSYSGNGSVPMVCGRIRCLYERDLNIIKIRYPPYNLDHWAQEGVLLIHACLTTEVGVLRKIPHEDKGWAYLTYQTIIGIDRWKRNVPFVFFGTYPSIFAPLVRNNPTIVLPDPAENTFSGKAEGLFEYLDELMPTKIRWKHPYDRFRS